MTLKEYFELLQEFIKEHPEALEYEVISSKDDEGNGYNRIYYSPTLGSFNGDDFSTELEDLEEGNLPINAVCIN